MERFLILLFLLGFVRKVMRDKKIFQVSCLDTWNFIPQE